ncbi:UTP--glucose-1-phosphate uridylyltransferase [Candidatus Kaiserbacteria bacterium RIFCSPHIGHO2_01_FULL_56_24]|uniref:UTP--glucose-1-phosphate uridylyltransferase n=1 Tax=Candidatus Kaiserbacteria bacterium RIFCSPHIGHO2_01_FULL_56_24 TaxID=1798487 RepID=A0A1F6DG22_9BACT|nr:MAG: UTP--glucose-1-phosphate uridylyltransferase [Candidatus Kaiserbacteria bacterium RIFCSPHIGHO2_01_FULL_56_24]
MQKVTKAIIPVAGMGTRFLPATKAMPKEMLPVIDKPVIQFLAEEAAASGITDITFVTGRSKRAIEDHFDAAPELEAALAVGGKERSLKLVQDISKIARISYVRQQSPKGDGDAILSASHLVSPDEAVGVMFGDDIVAGDTPALKQLMDVYEKYGETVIALTRVPKTEVSAYGVVAAVPVEGNVFKVTEFVEKPSPEKAPSDLAVIGKYIITPPVFDELRTLAAKGIEGELRLANALQELIKKRPVYGVELKGTRYDCGSKIGYLKATVDFALKHPEVQAEFKEYLRTVSKSL